MRKRRNTAIRTMAVWGLLFIGVLLGTALLGVSATGTEGALASIGTIWMGGLIYGVKMFDWSKINDIAESERVDAIVDKAAQIMRQLKEGKIENAKVVGADPNLQQSGTTVVTPWLTPLRGPDRGYEMIWEETDMRGSSNDHIDILGVSGAVTFKQRKNGEPAYISPIPDTDKSSLSHMEMVGGINILDSWLRYNKYYLIDKLFANIIKGYWKTKATLFYGMLTALSSAINIAFDTSDVKTINKACATILVNLEALETGIDDESAEFIITCNPMIADRIWFALNSAYLNPNSNNAKIIHTIRAVVTTTKIPATSYYVSIPGEGNIRGEWQDLTARPEQRDEVKGGATHVYVSDYNGIVSIAAQHARCGLS